MKGGEKMNKNKLNIGVRITSLIFLFVFSSLIYAQYGQTAKTSEKTMDNMPAMQKEALGMAMRKLWEDHIMWTRNYIISAVDNLSDVNKVAARLMKNQEDIGNAIKPYYGDAAGNKLTDLLKTHIMDAGELVKAAKANDAAAANMAEKKWYMNADDIVNFLTGANPNWTKSAMTDMLYGHLKLTKTEAVARISKDYDADIAAFDQIHSNALMMADMLTMGIIKQFPDKFGKMTKQEKKEK